MKTWHKITFYAKLDEEDKRALKSCFYDAMTEAIGIDECAELSIEQESKGYSAYLRNEDGLFIEDESTYESPEEAIEFAKNRNWDEVVDNMTGEIIWSKGE